MSDGQLVQCVVVSWYNEWQSAGTMSGGQLVQRVAPSWYNFSTFQLFQYEVGF